VASADLEGFEPSTHRLTADCAAIAPQVNVKILHY